MENGEWFTTLAMDTECWPKVAIEPLVTRGKSNGCQHPRVFAFRLMPLSIWSFPVGADVIGVHDNWVMTAEVVGLEAKFSTADVRRMSHCDSVPGAVRKPLTLAHTP